MSSLTGHGADATNRHRKSRSGKTRQRDLSTIKSMRTTNFWSIDPSAILRVILVPVVMVIGVIVSRSVRAEDLVEFANGSTKTGTIHEIRKSDREFDFSSTVGGRTFRRTYGYDQVSAVTYGGKRYVLNPSDDPGDGSASHSEADGANLNRTKDEVTAIIKSQGSQDPDWLATTPLNHPDSLELAWPLKAEGPWDESKNVAQYIWGRVNPNESRWKPGIKLVHECMNRHQDDQELLLRDMQKLGDMYFTLLQDYARAAYWLQKAKVTATTPLGVYLAECYWRLGSKPMAMEMLRGERLHFDAIKLLGDMGEIKRALSLTKAYSNSNVSNEAFLNMGDALSGSRATRSSGGVLPTGP